MRLDPTRPCGGSAEELWSKETRRSGALPPLNAGKARRRKRARERGQGPGEARLKETRVHATQAWQGGVTKMMVPEEGLLREKRHEQDATT
ncbi:unnamed protein product [Closterium sp. NIES-54]